MLDNGSLQLPPFNLPSSSVLRENIQAAGVEIAVTVDYEKPRQDGGWEASVLLSGTAIDAEIVRLSHQVEKNDETLLAHLLRSEQQPSPIRIVPTFSSEPAEKPAARKFFPRTTAGQAILWTYACQLLNEAVPIVNPLFNLPSTADGTARTLQLHDMHVSAAKSYSTTLLCAMSIELSLKLLVERDTEKRPGDTHDLCALFGELPAVRQDELDCYFSDFLRERGRATLPIVEAFRDYRHIFAEWRYAGELESAWLRHGKHELSIDPEVIYGLAVSGVMCIAGPEGFLLTRGL